MAHKFSDSSEMTADDVHANRGGTSLLSRREAVEEE